MTKQPIKPRHCGKLHWPKRLFAKAHPMITYPGAVMNAAPWQDEAFLAKRDLYLAAIDGPLCKIGVSRRPKRRVGGISMTQPHKAKLIKVWPTAGHLEPTVHHILRPLQQRGEWFKCEPDFAEWICEMVISQKNETAAHGVVLYKQLIDCEARSLRLRYVKGLENEGSRLLRAQISLENDLLAAGFDRDAYRLRIQGMQDREQKGRQKEVIREFQRKMMQDKRDQEEERRQEAIAALAPHQIAALHAVSASCGFDSIDAFTFDVLGHLGLLKRPKGRKAKTDWQLTDEGRAALDRHSQL
jgi:hypothetical protein